MHDLAIAAIGLAFGLVGALLVGALTVRGELQLFRAQIPHFVTKEYLNEALKYERHEMRGEVQKYGQTLEGELQGQIDDLSGRLRTVELRIARVVPPIKDETL